jgi:hypothetical protein
MFEVTLSYCISLAKREVKNLCERNVYRFEKA